MAKNKRASQKNQEISKTVKTLSFAAIALVTGLIATNYFVTSLNFHRQVYSKKNAVETQLKENLAALGELETGFENLKQQGPKPEAVFSALPTSADFPLTSATIESIANRSGAELENISVYDGASEYANPGADGYTSTNPEVQQIQFSVEVNGSYETLQEMIGRIEDSRRTFRVESVEFSGTGDNLNGRMLITAFFVPAVDNSIDKEVFSL